MAQSKVSDFFSARKASTSLHPSKRRKTDTTINTSTTFSEDIIKSPPLSSRTRSRKSAILQNTKSVKSLRATKQKSNSKKTVSDISQPQITEAFKSTEVPNSKELDTVTAAFDDHNGSPPCSPSKKKKGEATIQIQSKRSRKAKPIDLLRESIAKTPERGYDFTKCMENSVSARKKLILKSPSQARNKNFEESKISANEKLKAKTRSPHGTPDVHKTEKTCEESEKPLMDKTSDVSRVEEKHPEVKPIASSSLNDEHLIKKIDKQVNPMELKAKLMKSGKFAEVQSKLAEFSKKKEQLKLPEKREKVRPLTEKISKSTPKQPAYERFHDLAEPVPPSLGLPFKYKLLAEMFRGADQVVSMLQKRSEVCTFSKLKAAVQQLVRKNFEEKNLGQIKTVYPQAYVFRQEKGFTALSGQKQNTYQLTVEANLDTLPGQKNGNVQLDKYGKPIFTASHLTERNASFHRRLINIVKKHHKEFLAKLDNPLSIDGKDIKRWHPQFKLDSVPDIESAPLPQPPNVQKLTTASEVLEHAKGNLNSRIQRALMLATGQVPAKEKGLKTETEVKPNDNKQNAIPPKPQTSNTNLTGVSQSLLERIRAKEAAKTEAAMMRSADDEVRLKRIERLPELARILRTVYVTQKKPALPLDEVINKLGESYKSNMGKAESEKHVELLVELIPDWVQIVQIKRGKFMKMDKNKDINVIQNRLQQIFKQAK